MAKQLTREQAEARKSKAVHFVRDVLGDPDRAAEIEDEDVDSYVARRKIELINPKRSNRTMATNKELQDRVAELEAENQDLNDTLDAISDLVGSDDEDEDEDEEDNGQD